MPRYSKPNGSGCPISARFAAHSLVSGSALQKSISPSTESIYPGMSSSAIGTGPWLVFWQLTPAGSTGSGLAPIVSQRRKYS